MMNRIQVRDQSGDLIRYIIDWSNGRYAEFLNQPPTLSFQVHHDVDGIEDLVPGNEIWLAYENGATARRFVIRSTSLVGPDGMLSISCSGLLSLLSRYMVNIYATHPEYPVEVVEIIQALLDHQPEPARVEFGSTNLEGDIDYRVERQSILYALNNLQGLVGGDFWVDNENKFHWKETRGTFKGQQIRIGRNIHTIAYQTDFEGFGNRIFAYGAGTGADKLKLPSPGYVEDAASVSEYGPVEKQFHDRRITREETLIKFAERHLEMRKEPIKTYNVSAVDLARVSPEYSFDEWHVGDSVILVDERLGIETQVRVHSIERNLSDPLQSSLQLNNRTPDLSSLFADLYDWEAATQQHDPISYSLDGGQLDFEFDEVDTQPLWDAIDGLEFDLGEIQAGLDSLQSELDGIKSSMGGSESEPEWLTRTFVKDTLEEINDLAQSVEYPELEFRDGDRALVEGEPALYLRRGGAWVQTWKPYIEVDTYLELTSLDPQPPNGTRAFITGEGGYFYSRRSGSWYPMQAFDDVGGIPAHGWRQGDLHKASDGRISVIIESGETYDLVCISHFDG